MRNALLSPDEESHFAFYRFKAKQVITAYFSVASVCFLLAIISSLKHNYVIEKVCPITCF